MSQIFLTYYLYTAFVNLFLNECFELKAVLTPETVKNEAVIKPYEVFCGRDKFHQIFEDLLPSK